MEERRPLIRPSATFSPDGEKGGFFGFGATNMARLRRWKMLAGWRGDGAGSALFLVVVSWFLPKAPVPSAVFVGASFSGEQGRSRRVLLRDEPWVGRAEAVTGASPVSVMGG